MLLPALIFVTLFFTTLLCVGLGLAFMETQQRRQLRAMLQTAEPAGPTQQAVLVRGTHESNGLEQWLAQAPQLAALNRVLEESQSGWTAGRFFIMCAGGFAVAAFIGAQLAFFSSRLTSALILGGFAGLSPLLIVLRKRKKLIAAFEEQFPQALEFLSRSMRAGHAFTISIEILAADAAEPVASSFRRVSDEMRLGAPLKEALGKMLTAFPLVDVRFFVSAVLLQQETGGNLSEILDKLAYIIRERFRLKGQVKALSAHGRITGMVLLLMPVAVTLILLVLSPGYLNDMFNDRDGRLMLYGAVGGQCLAYLFIKKIVNIKV